MAIFKLIALAALSTLAAASPVRRANSSVIYVPATISLWDSAIPLVESNTGYGIVQRTAGGDDVSTLFTFAIPATYSSNTCGLEFSLLNQISGSTGSGSNMQLFTTQKAAVDGATSDYRNNEIATIKAVNGGYGVFGTPDGTTHGDTIYALPCSTLINNPYWEVAPQGDDVEISFAGKDGLNVIVYL